MRMRSQALEPGRELRDLGLKLLEGAVGIENAERGESHGAGQCVARIGVAVEEGAPGFVGAQEARENFLARQRRRERQVTPGDPLGNAHHVGCDALLLAGEESSGAPEAGGDLVGDEQDAMRIAELSQSPQVALGVDEHPGCALDQRLDHHRGQLMRLWAATASWLTADPSGSPGRRGRADHLEEELAKDVVKEIDAAGGNGADGVAVIGLAESQELPALGLAAALAEVLETPS